MMIGQEYRPKTLSEIVGHEKIVAEIKTRFTNKDWPQVSYFHGFTGTGKTTLAFNVAKLIQCQNKIDAVTPCNECQECRDINNESFINGTFMYNASNLDTDAMRDIDELSQVSSWTSDNKVIIIDEFQELYSNKKASKNLLKALEKPNKNTYFILLAMDDTKVDKAIRNRAVSYKLYPIDYMKISEYLYNICQSKGLELNEEQIDILMAIAENSAGSVRQACAHLERVLAGNIWNKEELKSILNFSSSEDIATISRLLIDRNPEVFNLELSDELLDRVKSSLVKFGKSLIGVKLNEWEKSQLKGLVGYKPATLSKVQVILDNLNELSRFSYTNREVIDSQLLKLWQVAEPIIQISGQTTPQSLPDPNLTLPPRDIAPPIIQEVTAMAQESEAPKRRRVQ